MNREKRKEILQILNKGCNAVNKSFRISCILNETEEDILRIINNLHWNTNHILTAFSYFPGAR